MNITIVGGGNIGTALCAEFAHNGHRVSLLTSKPQLFQSELSVVLADSDQTVFGTVDRISDRPQDVLSSAELIVVTLPAFLMKSFADSALAFVRPGTILVAMPGYGGVEYIFKAFVEKGVIMVGIQRVPAVYRLVEYGKCSRLSGRRPALHFAALPAAKTTEVQGTLESVFSMPCIALQNFPEGAIVSMPLRAAGMPKSKTFWYGVLSGIVEPIAALLTIVAASAVVSVLPYMLAFAAGAMMYVVVEELIPEMSEGKHSNIGTVAFALGFVLMMVLDVALG